MSDNDLISHYQHSLFPGRLIMRVTAPRVLETVTYVIDDGGTLDTMMTGTYDV